MKTFLYFATATCLVNCLLCILILIYIENKKARYFCSFDFAVIIVLFTITEQHNNELLFAYLPVMTAFILGSNRGTVLTVNNERGRQLMDWGTPNTVP